MTISFRAPSVPEKPPLFRESGPLAIILEGPVRTAVRDEDGWNQTARVTTIHAATSPRGRKRAP